MWCTSESEIRLAHDAFPAHAEEIEHTALYCDVCKSVIFPRARETLTRRTDGQLLTTTHGKHLKVSNFQLSMPHVEGCPRKGMPIKTATIQLPKSELKFVLDRLDQCPFAPRVHGGPQYRQLDFQVISQQNHLHQVYLRLLETVVQTFDPKTHRALDPLRKMLGLFGNMEPLALFQDWSPHEKYSDVTVAPAKVHCSSELDEQHGAKRVLECGDSCWRPASDSSTSTSKDEWISFQFDSPVALSAVIVQWNPDHYPKTWVLSASSDDSPFEPISVVVRGGIQNRVAFSKLNALSAIRVSVPQADCKSSFGLQSVTFRESNFDSHQTKTISVLQMLMNWLSDGMTSSVMDVRDLSLQVLQRMVLATGSLCGTLQLVSGLLSTGSFTGGNPVLKMDDWSKNDQLSNNALEHSLDFLRSLAERIEELISEGSFRSEIECDQPEVKVDEQNPRDEAKQLDEAKEPGWNEQKSTRTREVDSIFKAARSDEFLGAITKRSQVAMVVLQMLGELSNWQMKRMQKSEEFIGKKGSILTSLAEPFSIDVRPEAFTFAHQILETILSEWLSVSSVTTNDKDASNTAALYGLLHDSSTAIVEGMNNTDLSIFSVVQSLGPDAAAVGVLQVVTSNIRRLVLSHVDPSDVGIDICSLENTDEKLSPPQALTPLVDLLEKLISLGTKRTDRFFGISLKAAAAIEVGMEAFFPSPRQRTLLLTSRMGQGATIEVQVQWPVQERDQEDPRYERLMLMLQFECIRTGFNHAVRGCWQYYMHLVVQIPEHMDTEHALKNHFAPCIQEAGFSSWQVVAGAQEISINLQRHLHWNRIEKMAQDSGSGWIRVYPKEVAAFDEVLSDVGSFISLNDNQVSP